MQRSLVDSLALSRFVELALQRGQTSVEHGQLSASAVEILLGGGRFASSLFGVGSDSQSRG